MIEVRSSAYKIQGLIDKNEIHLPTNLLSTYKLIFAGFNC